MLFITVIVIATTEFKTDSNTENIPQNLLYSMIHLFLLCCTDTLWFKAVITLNGNKMYQYIEVCILFNTHCLLLLKT